MTALAERLAALKADYISIEKSKEPTFTLAHYLYIYKQANRECFIEYMHGAVELYNWLTEGKGLNLEIKKHPKILDVNYPLDIFGSWETSEIAKIISTLGECTDSYVSVPTYNKYDRAVLITLYEDVIPLIYKTNTNN